MKNGRLRSSSDVRIRSTIDTAINYLEKTCGNKLLVTASDPFRVPMESNSHKQVLPVLSSVSPSPTSQHRIANFEISPLNFSQTFLPTARTVQADQQKQIKLIFLWMLNQNHFNITDK